jgi:ankyrin repeat protein
MLFLIVLNHYLKTHLTILSKTNLLTMDNTNSPAPTPAPATSNLWIVARWGDTEAARAILEAGLEAGKPVDVDEYDAEGATAAFTSCAHGRLEMLKYLVLEGCADASKPTPDGFALLVDPTGAWKKTAGGGGATPLSIASAYNRIEVVRWLIAHRVDVDQANVNGGTPLIRAAAGGYVEVVALLLQGGADVNKPANDLATPVYVASYYGHTATLDILLKNGGLVNASNGDDIGPMHVAAMGGHVKAVRSLIRSNGDVNQVAKDGTSPLCYAVFFNHIEVVKLLIKYGADTTERPRSIGLPAFASHVALHLGDIRPIEHLAVRHPLDVRPWYMFLMGGGASSELQDYLVPPANRTTRNYVPRLYSKADMVREIWTYLHKPRYLDVKQIHECTIRTLTFISSPNHSPDAKRRAVNIAVILMGQLLLLAPTPGVRTELRVQICKYKAWEATLRGNTITL